MMQLFFQHRLEDLFLIEEDVKHEDERDEEAEDAGGSAAHRQTHISHPQVRIPLKSYEDSSTHTVDYAFNSRTTCETQASRGLI